MKSTPIEECNGKALRGSLFHMSEQYLLLVWTDGSVTELCSEGDEDDSVISQTGRYSEICFDGYDFEDLIMAGVDSGFVDGLRQARHAKLLEVRDRAKQERQAEYERLKKEFDR